MLDFLLLVSTAAFIVAGGVVGVRLLLLAARTRELSDWIVGFSLFDLSAVAYPLILMGTLGDLSLADAKLVTTLSSVSLALGWGGVFVFTKRVFRPDERWALALVGAGFAMLAYGLAAGLPHIQHAPDRATLLAAAGPGMWVEYAAILVYAWTSLEGFRCWSQARRRLRLGLTDPLVVNRFLLWGWIGVASLLSVAPSTLISLAGGEGSTSVVGRLCTALGGLVAAGALQLAFLPPARYRAWIAQGAPA